MTTHTPLLWGFCPHSGEIVFLNGAELEPLIATVNFENTSEEQAIADGELIVKAVNNHAALVRVLKFALDETLCSEPDPEDIPEWVPHAQALLETLK